MKNLHLVPPAVHDIIVALESGSLGENERLALIQRLETIRDTCNVTLTRITREAEIKPLPKKKFK